MIKKKNIVILSLLLSFSSLNAFDTNTIYITNTQNIIQNNIKKLQNNIKVLEQYTKEYIKDTGNLEFNLEDLKNKYNININNNITDIKLKDNAIIITLKNDFRYKDYLGYTIIDKKVILPLTGDIEKFVNYLEQLQIQGINNTKTTGLWYKVDDNYKIILMKNDKKLGEFSINGISNFVVDNTIELDKLPKIEGMQVTVKNYDKVENYVYNKGKWKQSDLYDDKFNGVATITELATTLWTKPADSIANVNNIDQSWTGYKLFKKILVTDTDLKVWTTKDNKFYVMDNYTDTINHIQVFPEKSIVYFYYNGKVLKAIKTSFNGKKHMYLFFYTLQEAASNLLDIPTNYQYVYVKETNSWYKIIEKDGKYNLVTLDKTMIFDTYDNHGNTYTYSYYNIITYDRQHLITDIYKKDPYNYIILSYTYNCSSTTCNINNSSKAKKYYNLYAFYKIPIPNMLESHYDDNQISDSIVVDAELWTDEFDNRAGELYNHFEPGFNYCQADSCADNNFVPAEDAYKDYIACSEQGEEGIVKINLKANGSIDDWISVFQFFNTTATVSSDISCTGANTSTAPTPVCGSGEKKWRKYYLNTQHRERFNNVFPSFRGINLKTIDNNGEYSFNNTWKIITPEYKSVFLIAEGTETGRTNRELVNVGCITHWGGTEMKYKNSLGINKKFFPSYMRTNNFYKKNLASRTCCQSLIGVNLDNSTELFGFILPTAGNYEFKFYSDFDCSESNYLGNLEIERNILKQSYDNNALMVNISKIFGGKDENGNLHTNYPKTGCIKVINKDSGDEYITELPYYFKHPFYNFTNGEEKLPQYMTLLVMQSHSCYNSPTTKTFGVDLTWLQKN